MFGELASFWIWEKTGPMPFVSVLSSPSAAFKALL
jgi:hypothetical protein